MAEKFSKTVWEFGNNIDCGGGATVTVTKDRVTVTVDGGCWGGNTATVTITRNKVIIEDMHGKKYELPAPWAR